MSAEENCSEEARGIFADEAAVLRYIDSFRWSPARSGAEQERELLSLLGDPQQKLKFIHVAGSNGKGSTCAMLAEILMRAGYKTGLYTSPYIEEFGERIRVNGENIPEQELIRAAAAVAPAVAKLAEKPSQFVLVTAMAMVYFAAAGCDIVVLEVGLGGLFDATNAIPAPEVGVITNLALEHTEFLGDTLEKIAAHKAGILKTGCDCVLYDSAPEVKQTVSRIAAERGVSVRVPDFASLVLSGRNLEGQDFSYRGRAYHLALLGDHQLYNAAVVLETVDMLGRRGFLIPEEAVQSGLSQVAWPVRMEVIRRDPVLILDGGHNPQCAAALSDGLRELFPEGKAVFLVSLLSNRDHTAILKTLLPRAAELICIPGDDPHALSPAVIAEDVRTLGGRARTAESAEAGLALALSEAEKTHRPAVFFGCLYTAGHLRSLLRGRKALEKDQIKKISTCERIKNRV